MPGILSEGSAGVDANLAKHVGKVGSVTEQLASSDHLAQSVVRSKRGKVCRPPCNTERNRSCGSRSSTNSIRTRPESASRTHRTWTLRPLYWSGSPAWRRCHGDSRT